MSGQEAEQRWTIYVCAGCGALAPRQQSDGCTHRSILKPVEVIPASLPGLDLSDEEIEALLSYNVPPPYDVQGGISAEAKLRAELERRRGEEG